MAGMGDAEVEGPSVDLHEGDRDWNPRTVPDLGGVVGRGRAAGSR